MGKDIMLHDGDRIELLENVSKLETNLSEGGSCYWVPEDGVQLTPLAVTRNGTYKASDKGYYGFSEVNVSGVTSTIMGDAVRKNIEIKQNGLYTYKAAEDGHYGYSEAKIMINVNDENAVVDDPSTGNESTKKYDTTTGNPIYTSLPSYIRVETMPNKIDYMLGEEINYDGIEVYAYKKDGEIWKNNDYPNGRIPFNELILPTQEATTTIDNNESQGVRKKYQNCKYTPKNIKGFELPIKTTTSFKADGRSYNAPNKYIMAIFLNDGGKKGGFILLVRVQDIDSIQHYFSSDYNICKAVKTGYIPTSGNIETYSEVVRDGNKEYRTSIGIASFFNKDWTMIRNGEEFEKKIYSSGYDPMGLEVLGTDTYNRWVSTYDEPIKSISGDAYYGVHYLPAIENIEEGEWNSYNSEEIITGSIASIAWYIMNEQYNIINQSILVNKIGLTLPIKTINSVLFKGGLNKDDYIEDDIYIEDDAFSAAAICSNYSYKIALSGGTDSYMVLLKKPSYISTKKKYNDATKTQTFLLNHDRVIVFAFSREQDAIIELEASRILNANKYDDTDIVERLKEIDKIATARHTKCTDAITNIPIDLADGTRIYYAYLILTDPRCNNWGLNYKNHYAASYSSDAVNTIVTKPDKDIYVVEEVAGEYYELNLPDNDSETLPYCYMGISEREQYKVNYRILFEPSTLPVGYTVDIYNNIRNHKFYSAEELTKNYNDLPTVGSEKFSHTAGSGLPIALAELLYNANYSDTAENDNEAIQTLRVGWNRPKDGKQLNTAFDINVSSEYNEGNF